MLIPLHSGFGKTTPPPPSGITYVAAGTAKTWELAITSIVLDLPTCSNGDTMVAFVGSSGVENVTVPAGWTEVGQYGTATSQDRTMSLAIRVKDGSEGSTATWTQTSADAGGVVLAYSGVVSVTSTDANLTHSATGTTHASYVGTLPTVADGDMVLWTLFLRIASSFPLTITPPTGTSTHRLNASASESGQFSVAEQALTSSTPPSIDNWTLSGSGQALCGPILLKGS